MSTRCPPKRVLSADRFFTHCRLTHSYSVGGQRSPGQLTGKPAGARPDYRGRWCALSRGQPGRPNPPSPRVALGQLSTAPWKLPSSIGKGIAWTRTCDVQTIGHILHSTLSAFTGCATRESLTPLVSKLQTGDVLSVLWSSVGSVPAALLLAKAAGAHPLLAAKAAGAPPLLAAKAAGAPPLLAAKAEPAGMLPLLVAATEAEPAGTLPLLVEELHGLSTSTAKTFHCTKIASAKWAIHGNLNSGLQALTTDCLRYYYSKPNQQPCE
ncbi:UNVERIFIED_CONTAM: hypothetical protein FKN15_035018 [Acipenser sinensis]